MLVLDLLNLIVISNGIIQECGSLSLVKLHTLVVPGLTVMIYVDLLVVARHVHVILNVKEYLTVSTDVLRDVDADSGVQFPFKS